MSNDSNPDGCGGCMILIILVILAVMCSRQAKNLGYRDSEVIRPEIIDIKIYDNETDSLALSYS